MSDSLQINPDGNLTFGSQSRPNWTGNCYKTNPSLNKQKVILMNNDLLGIPLKAGNPDQRNSWITEIAWRLTLNFEKTSCCQCVCPLEPICCEHSYVVSTAISYPFVYLLIQITFLEITSNTTYWMLKKIIDPQLFLKSSLFS